MLQNSEVSALKVKYGFRRDETFKKVKVKVKYPPGGYTREHVIGRIVPHNVPQRAAMCPSLSGRPAEKQDDIIGFH